VVILLILLVCFLSILLLFNFQASSNEYLAFNQNFKLLQTLNFKKSDYINSIETKLIDKNPILTKLVGDKVFFKLLLPSFLVIIFSSAFIAPMLTKDYFVSILAPLISMAYIFRNFYHHSTKFKELLLNDLERIFQLIRNNLSSGTTIDYALNFTISNSPKSLILDDLKSFININQRNILEYFPLWFKSLEKKYNLMDLAGASQLLALQLKFNNNQEEAMILATENIAQTLSNRKQQKNTILVAFISLDFFVIMFFAVLFWVLPNLSSTIGQSWWTSNERPLVVFASAAILWAIYTLVVFCCWRRMN